MNGTSNDNQNPAAAPTTPPPSNGNDKTVSDDSNTGPIKGALKALKAFSTVLGVSILLISAISSFSYSFIKPSGYSIEDINIRPIEFEPIKRSVDDKFVRVRTYIQFKKSSSLPKGNCKPPIWSKVYRMVISKKAYSKVVLANRADNDFRKVLINSSDCNGGHGINQQVIDVYDGVLASKDIENFVLTFDNSERPASTLAQIVKIFHSDFPDIDKMIDDNIATEEDIDENNVLSFSRINFPKKQEIEVKYKNQDKAIYFDLVSELTSLEPVVTTEVETKVEADGTIKTPELEPGIESETVSETTLTPKTSKTEETASASEVTSTPETPAEVRNMNWSIECESSIPNAECSYSRLIRFWRISKKNTIRSLAPYFETEHIWVGNDNHTEAPFLINMIFKKPTSDKGHQNKLGNLRSVTPIPHHFDNEKEDLFFLVKLSENDGYDYDSYTKFEYTPNPSDKGCLGEALTSNNKCNVFYKVSYAVENSENCADINDNSLSQESTSCKINRIYFEKVSTLSACNIYRENYPSANPSQCPPPDNKGTESL